MKIKVPATVDVSELVMVLKLSPTKSRNLIDKIYYFLSLLVANNDNVRLNDENEGFRNICSTQIKKILGNKDYTLILKILLNSTKPIIESNNSWYNPSSIEKKGYCKGYRLVSKYNSGEVVFKTLTNRLSDLIKRNYSKENDTVENIGGYDFLLNKFDQHKLTIHKDAYDYIYRFGNELISRVDDKNEYQIKMINNLIGRWLYYILKIKKKDIWYSVSSKNHRLSSSITNLPRVLRQFLLCDTKQFGFVDISSSQPYVLASIMGNSFFKDISNGYNLLTIYPELYNKLNDNGYIINNSDNIFKNSDNNLMNYYSTYSGETINNYISTITKNSFNNKFNTGTSSFMWCSFFSSEELTSISRYKQSPFNDDFYLYVIKTSQNSNSSIKESDIQNERQKLKSSFMYVLFDDNQNHRNNNLKIQLVKNVFSGVDKWICEAHKVIGKQHFAYLLQRAESYLILKTVCRELIESYPELPLFTIHDAILSYPNHLPVITSYLKNRFKEITGIDVGVKIKYPQINLEPQLLDIESEWDRIKGITTNDKFNKVCGGVFISNVQRGSDFLKKTRKILKRF